MTKDELTAIVEHANASWGLNPFKDDLTKQKKAWWHFLADLEAPKVMKTIDKLALIGGFPPRPGDVRRLTVVGRLPSAIEAWGELQAARQAVYGGSQPSPVSEMTKATVKRLGDQQMTTNGDRDKFIETYNLVLADYVEEQCALP